jgi:hypothetical protein
VALCGHGARSQYDKRQSHLNANLVVKLGLESQEGKRISDLYLSIRVYGIYYSSFNTPTWCSSRRIAPGKVSLRKMCREVVSYGLKNDFAGLSTPPPENGRGYAQNKIGIYTFHACALVLIILPHEQA